MYVEGPGDGCSLRCINVQLIFIIALIATFIILCFYLHLVLFHIITRFIVSLFTIAHINRLIDVNIWYLTKSKTYSKKYIILVHENIQKL